MSAYARPVMESTQGAPDPGAAGDRPRREGAGEPEREPGAGGGRESEGADPGMLEAESPADASNEAAPDESALEEARLAADGAALRAAEAAAIEEARLAEHLAAVRVAEAAGDRARGGLRAWALVVAIGGAVSLVANRPDLAIFLFFAAMFALSQSWDARDRSLTGDAVADQWLEPSGLGRVFRLLLPTLLPAIGAIGFASLAIWTLEISPSRAHTAALQWSVGAAAVCALMLVPPVARLFAATLVRPPAATYTARLTASLAMIALLLPVPMRLVFDQILPLFSNPDRALVDVTGLIGQLAGEVLFALAAVGLWVSRTPRETWVRLGLGPMGAREWLVALAGLITVSGLNSTLEWAERTWLPHLWKQDQLMGEMITRDMGLGTALVLGLSAGVGEEVLVRGALQPRTGLLWASLLFAVAHVQYTWFGMLVIALLGITLGLVRRHTNTTTAIVVHGVYDVVAAFGMAR